MQLSVLSSIGLLSLVGHHVQANPIATTSNICTLPWVKLGELALNLLPSSEGPRLCSSVLYKYATTTRTTTITAPTVTKVATASDTSTIPAVTTSVTTTVSVESDISTSTTTTTTATTTYAETTSLPPSTTGTITASVNEKRAATSDPGPRLASMLNIASTLVSEFCSCEAPGTTSTSTVIVSSTTTPATTVLTTVIATTFTPQPTTVLATVSTTFTSVVSTVVIPSSATTTVTSTVTLGGGAATVTNPGCPTQLTATNPFAGTAHYNQYFFSTGLKENANNPGTPGAPPFTTTFPAGDFCSTLQECAQNTVMGGYYSIDFHFLISEDVYECTAYYNANSDPGYFNVQDEDVGQVYGYTVGRV